MNHPDKFEPSVKTELDKLKDFIETRKASLEDEIEETLHQAVADAKDSLELIRENIEPKVEKIIQSKMEYIDNKMENWKKDFRNAAHEEVEVGSKDLVKKVLENLDVIIQEKKNSLKEELLHIIRTEIKTDMEPRFKQATESIQRVQSKTSIAIWLAAFSIAGALFLELVQ